MRISFDYEIENINDIESATSFIKNMIDTNDCHITSANLYLSIKNKDNEPCYIGDAECNKTKYIVRNKPYKKSNKSEPYVILDSDGKEKLYIYEGVDKT